MFEHPALLLGTAQPHPEDIHIEGVDLVDHGLIFIGSEGAERRSVGAGDVSLGEASAQGSLDVRGAAIEVVAPVFVRFKGEGFEHETRTI